tara:strand:+ start:6725 stop:7147 length:423 start_codon:yes stop_codon:yes gene_type:complete
MTRPRIATDYIVVHGAYSYPEMDIGFKEIDLWHRKRGFMRVGYHSIIRRNGEIETGRKPHLIGAGVYGHNDVSYHICLAGGQSPEKQWEFNYTDVQMDSLRKHINEVLITYPKAKVMGHCDFPAVKKQCPAFDVAAWFYD